MSKFKLNSEANYSEKNYSDKKHKKHSGKKHYNGNEDDDFGDFAYMKRSSAKNELRNLRDMYGI